MEKLLIKIKNRHPIQPKTPQTIPKPKQQKKIPQTPPQRKHIKKPKQKPKTQTNQDTNSPIGKNFGSVISLNITDFCGLP